MPAATRPITYSRDERLEGKVSFLKAKIADNEAAVLFHRRGTGRRYYPLAAPCGQQESEIAISALKRNPGTTFDECLAALRAE